MANERPRFDVELEGRRARLRLAAPISAPYIRLVRLDAALEPIAGRFDLRAGALAFRHRRSTAVSVALEIDLVAMLEAASAAGVRILARGADARGLEVIVDDGRGQVRRRLEPEADGIDLRLRAVDADEAGDAARWVAALPRTAGVELAPGAIRVRDPIGWGLREALLPLGFRAPRVVGGELSWSLAGKRLDLTLRTEEP